MKKIFTKLVCVGIACFCMLPAMGQEKMTGGRLAEVQALIMDDVQLRASEKQQPDSVVRYNEEGYIVAVLHNPIEGPRIYYSDYYKAWCESIDHFYVILHESKYDVKYNSHGLVESMTHTNESNTTFLRQFQYNANDYLLSEIETLRYAGNTSWRNNNQTTYAYDVYENWIGLQGFNFYSNRITNVYNVRVDSKGRIVYSERFSLYDNGRGNLIYYIWYYSDGRTSDVVVENNNPINDNNQGNFDVDVNIPIDSINNGSITVTLPDGFTLDDTNTSLTLDFAGNFELKITKHDNNSWLLEIKPKTTKNASIRASEAKTMLHVAYKVDEKKQKGTYDILVNRILFESKGGNFYPEPAITVSAVVNRWGVGNELTPSLSPSVYMNAQTIYVQTESAEQVSVYSITGSNLCETTIPAGLNTINAANFPKGILFVKGSSGWVKKLLNK